MAVDSEDEVIDLPRQPVVLGHLVEATSSGAQYNPQQAVHQRPVPGPAVHLRSTPLQSFRQQLGESNIQFTTTQGGETSQTGAKGHVSHQINNYVAGGTSTIHYGDVVISPPSRTIFDFADKSESKDLKHLMAKKAKHQAKRLVSTFSVYVLNPEN